MDFLAVQLHVRVFFSAAESELVSLHCTALNIL